MFIKNFFIGLINWIGRVAKDFADIYYIENEEEVRESYSERYVENLVELDANTGKRRISIVKILQRILIVAVIVFFVFIFIRIGAHDGWQAGY